MHDVSRFWFGQECPDKRCHLASSVCGGGDSSVKRQKTGATWRMMGLSLPPDTRDGMTFSRGVRRVEAMQGVSMFVPGATVVFPCPYKGRAEATGGEVGFSLDRSLA